MPLSLLELGAVVLTFAAVAGWLNATQPRLPVAVALLAVGLLAGLALRAAASIWPGAGGVTEGLLAQVRYPDLVLNFLLAYLLFAGALNVDVAALIRRGLAVAVLATAGVLISAAVIGAGFWWLTRTLGYPVPFVWSLVFGFIVSPTDPVAVLATVKRTSLERFLKAQIEGEALFNDGVAVVFFRAALGLAVAASAGHAAGGAVALEVAKEALGGGLLGAGIGAAVVLATRMVDDAAAETLITVAVATGVYALCQRLGLSGPIGVVAAGLVIGSEWGERSTSDHVKRYLHPFWHLVDETLNGILFLLMGLQVFNLPWAVHYGWIALAAIPLGLAARWLSIAIPGLALPLTGRPLRLGLLNLLTWAGVRGGLSAAMALALPEGPYKGPIVAATFAVAVFSILIQSTTAEKLVVSTGYGGRAAG